MEEPHTVIVCNERIETTSYRTAINIVSSNSRVIIGTGKECSTTFKRISYDLNTDTSIVECSPKTGRTHQIRVHLQYLGHVIANDSTYNDAAWGPERGKGGVDLTCIQGIVEGVMHSVHPEGR